MEQTSPFQDLLNAAFQDYQTQTGNSLVDHPFAKQLDTCHSVDSIIAILQDQAKSFANLEETVEKSIRHFS